MKRLRRIRERLGTRSSVMLAVAYAAVLAVETVVVALSGDAWPFELAVGLALGGLALVRARNPFGTATLGLVACAAADLAAIRFHLPSQPGLAATIGLFLLGAACVRSAGALQASVIAFIGFPVMVVGRLGVRIDPVPLILVGLLCWLAAVALGLGLRYQDVRRREAVEAARREERLQLARELHDVVAHHVTGMVVQAQAARLVAARRPQAAVEALAAIEGAGAEALAAMRGTIGLLREDDAGGRSVGPQCLGDLVDRFAGQHPSAEVRFSASCDEGTWPPETAATAQRIVQESLTNVARHAQDARTVLVEVDEEESNVTITVSDDAPSQSSAGSPHGYGLVGMHERVGALGGTFEAGPKSGGGWSVRATLPLTSGGVM